MAQNPPNSSILYLGSKPDTLEPLEHSDGAIWSAWAGSSIKFYSLVGCRSCSLKIGSKTERKDRWNGGTSRGHQTKTFEAAPGMLVQLWDEPIKKLSYLILFIGDSLTCGLALERSGGGQPIPQGVLDAFPSRAVVAYPGISLTRLGRPEDDDSAASSENLGMTDKFFHKTPWDTTAWTTRGSPRFICIALGTNDEANDVPPDLFRLTLERFIQRLSAAFPSVKAVYLVFAVNGLSVEVCSGINDGMTLEDTVDGPTCDIGGAYDSREHLAQFLAPRLAPVRLEESH
ncbi:hypothetical protein B0H14DRAFT_2833211 [Mycena olivaceomarginata]|nr:hypothetical protein B0H14DRAFT_2833211 [Mycena olivaceomarginata]